MSEDSGLTGDDGGDEDEMRILVLRSLEFVSIVTLHFLGFFKVLLVGRSISLAVTIEEFAEALEGTIAVVINDFIATLGEKFNGGEALDLDLLEFVGGGVHLGDDDISIVLVLLTQLVPDGSQLLAV